MFIQCYFSLEYWRNWSHVSELPQPKITWLAPAEVAPEAVPPGAVALAGTLSSLSLATPDTRPPLACILGKKVY